MSNDLKFWVARFALAAFVVLDVSLLGRIPIVVMEPGRPHLRLTIVLFALSLLVSMSVAMYYYYAKSRRWEATHKNQDQIALETLAKIGARQRKGKS